MKYQYISISALTVPELVEKLNKSTGDVVYVGTHKTVIQTGTHNFSEYTIQRQEEITRDMIYAIIKTPTTQLL